MSASPRKSKMLNRVLSPAKSRIIWTENRRVHKAKVSVTLRSKNKIGGFPSKECMQECVSEFISFITSEASEKCQQEKRKTVNGEDILFAMTTLGFENYSEALKIYLSKYREIETHPNLQGPTTRADRPAAGAPRPVALAPITLAVEVGEPDLDEENLPEIEDMVSLASSQLSKESMKQHDRKY